ncbi:MAG TPA: M48 family metalloprotease [Phycisphaerales bacterium]|nr:M48 family metalloprotease [Phycisphaerales bacterium]
MAIYRQNTSRENAVGLRIPPRLFIAVIIGLISVVTYCSRQQMNTVTGRTQAIALTPEQEIYLGQQMAPQMAAEFGNELRDPQAQALVDAVGERLLRAMPAEYPDYPFEFHLLADQRTVNAFALPGGQVFITAALFSRLETEGQLAGVLGHEIGHVLGRHSAERMAKTELGQGIVGAVGVAGSDVIGQHGATQIAGAVSNMMLLKYGRQHELESDALGLQFMANAKYDPRAMIRVMEILRESSGGAASPEWSRSHPDPGNRIIKIQEWIDQMYPNGVPAGLTP